MEWYEVVSQVVLVLTLLAVAWQARETARQARATRAVAEASTLNDIIGRLGTVMGTCVEHPELRVYLEGGQPLPSSVTERARVQSLAEMWADCVEAGLYLGRNVEAFRRHAEDWRTYAEDMLRMTPVVRELVAQRPAWWPELERVRRTLPDHAASPSSEIVTHLSDDPPLPADSTPGPRGGHPQSE
jgi:hypothetical protein